jgi:hypothetical protein
MNSSYSWLLDPPHAYINAIPFLRQRDQRIHQQFIGQMGTPESKFAVSTMTEAM